MPKEFFIYLQLWRKFELDHSHHKDGRPNVGAESPKGFKT